MAAALALTLTMSLGWAPAASANVPEREVGGIGCITDGTGHVQFLWRAPLTGVVVFDGQFPADVNTTDGLDIERTAGGLFVRAFTDGLYSLNVTSTPSSPCLVSYAVDSVPANDETASAESLAGRDGAVQGTTRAAVIDPAEPKPTEGALRVVWYRWSGATGDATFTVSPHTAGGLLDPGNGVTSVGVAVFDPSDLAEPLVVGGDGVAPQEGGGTGGSVTLPVTAGSDYLVAVFSAGGTGTMASQYGYTAAGAFTLEWQTPNSPPDATDDAVETRVDTPVQVDVLANDTDPNGDALTIVDLGPTSEGGTVSFGSGDLVNYTPPSTFVGVDSFTYDVEDGHGGSDQAVVNVYVDIPLPGPSPVQVTPSPVRFNAVPLGKTADVPITITNISESSVGPFFFAIDQGAPSPFDATVRGSMCQFGDLSPGGSCTQTIRFWSVPDAGAASPATLKIFDLATSELVGTVSLVGSTAPPVPPETPNADPVATDDVMFAASGFTHMLDALANDYDLDHDALTIVDATDPPHGSLGGIVRCADFVSGLSPQATCISYTPDPGFRGVDRVPYTISDGRGGTASAAYWIAVDNPALTIDSVVPDEGPPEGGQTVVINGDNFMPGTLASFVCSGVGHPAPITALSATQITVTTPPMTPGQCDVRVQFAPLAAGILANGYTAISQDNGPPVANDDSATVRQTNTVSIPVLANDSDPDGDVIHAVADTQPAHGRLDSSVTDVYEYTPNAGYLGPDEFTYTIEDVHGARATATVHITVTEGLGSVRANVAFDGAGLALGEQACFALVGAAGQLGGDQCVNAAVGTAVFSAVPLGSYSVGVAYLPSIAPALPRPRLPARFVVPAPVPVTVARDGLAEIISVAPKLRELRVGAVNPDGAAVGPMCYRLTPVAAGSGAPTLETCTFLVLGVPVAQFTNVWGGLAYRLDITQHPPGLTPSAGENGKTVGPFDDTTQVNSTIVTLGDVVSVRLEGPDGALFPGGCLTIFIIDFIPSPVATACDDADGSSDGVTLFSGLAPGNYFVKPTPFPAGPYGWTSRGAGFAKTAGASAIVTYRLQPARTATVTMVNDAGGSVPGGCLQVLDGSDTVGDGVRCDGDDGTTDAVVHFEHLPTPFSASPQQVFGAFSRPAPAGHLPSSSVPIAYDANLHASLTYTWRLHPNTTSAARLEGPDGALFPGGCLTIFIIDFIPSPVATACDDADGSSDGVTLFSGLAPGNYFVKPTPFPAGPYGWTSRGAGFAKTAGASAIVTYRLQPARTATVTMVNDAGGSVPGGCLQVLDGSDTVGDGVRCDGDDGTTDAVVHFEHLPTPFSASPQHVFGAFSRPAPAGHLPSSSVPIAYDANLHASLTYTWRLHPNTTSAARLEGPDGALFPGGCLTIFIIDFIPSPVATACDDADGSSDGVTLFSGLAPGNYFVKPTPFPAGPYGWTSRGAGFAKTAGASAIVTYRLQPARTATVTMVNDAGGSVPGGCLQVLDGSDTVGDGVRCDGDDGTTDAVVHFEHLPTPFSASPQHVFGAFSRPAPAGHLPSSSVPIAYDANLHASLTYTWRLLDSDFDGVR